MLCTLLVCVCIFMFLNSIQFILYRPISEITNLPQRDLQSVHIRHHLTFDLSHRMRKKKIYRGKKHVKKGRRHFVLNAYHLAEFSLIVWSFPLSSLGPTLGG